MLPILVWISSLTFGPIKSKNFDLGSCDFIREVQNIVVFRSAKVRDRGVLSQSERRL